MTRYHVTNYAEAMQALNGRARRKLENNTYLETHLPDTIAVRLHDTDVVTYYKDGRVVLNSGGWRTSTTKDRLNKYSPVNVWTRNGLWYVSIHVMYDDAATRTFQDGLTYHNGGTLTGHGTTPKNLNKEKRAINTYAKGYVQALAKGLIDAPGAGDCFYCHLHEVKSNRPLGEVAKDASHVRLHLQEKDYVPSLAYNALETFGGSIVAKDTLYRLTHGGKVEHECWDGVGLEQIRRAIRRYVSRQLGYQA